MNASSLLANEKTELKEKQHHDQKMSWRCPALDGIRGLAILLVFCVHYGDLSHSHSTLLRTIGTIKESGWIGVDLFFALSGFLITGILYESRSESKPWRNFYMRRALRLFPLFYAVWIFLLIYCHIKGLEWKSDYLAFLLYAGNFVSHRTGSLGPFGIGQFWSLAVEEQYYLLWPFIVWRVKSPRKLMYLLAAAMIGSFLFKICLDLLHANPALIAHLLPSHVEGLALGSFAALCLRGRFADRFRSYAKKALPVALGLLLLLALAKHGLYSADRTIQLIAYPLLAIIGTSLITAALNTKSLVNRTMSNSILMYYGKISYGLYIYNSLLHDTLKKYLYPVFGHIIHSSMVANVAYTVFCLLTLTLVSTVSFYFLERPFLNLKRFFESGSHTKIIPTG